jgi:hypothetical protein
MRCFPTFFNGGTPKIILNILRNPYLLIPKKKELIAHGKLLQCCQLQDKSFCDFKVFIYLFIYFMISLGNPKNEQEDLRF